MPDPSARFELHVEGRGTLRLGPADYVATGGEGSVWRKGNLAIKVWESPARAVQGRMVEKIRLLSALKHPCVVAPEALANDSRGQAVGYVMPWVESSWALPMAFTNDWRTSQGFGDSDALAFAARMREVMSFVHGHGVVMGDANELNVLGVGRGASAEPRYIDVDPWVLPGFPGDKILPTVRDWHAPLFSKQADWFAWAVTTFQLLTGIHPYRGTHPDFKRTDLDGRMQAKVSVFDSQVRLPPSVRPLNRIPGVLLDWYQATFRDGLREVPPDPTALPVQRAPAMATRRVAKDARLVLADMFRLTTPMVREVAPDLLMLSDGSLVGLPDGRQYGRVPKDAVVARNADGTLASLVLENGVIGFDIHHPGPGRMMASQASGIAARGMFSGENRLFAITRDGLLELKAEQMGAKKMLLPGSRWGLNPDTTFFGNGLALHDALGAKFLVVPHGTAAVAMLRVRELDGLDAVAAIRRGRVAVLSLIGRDGHYRRATVLFSEGYAECSVRLDPADDGSLDAAITPSGVVVRLDADGKLDLQVPATGAGRKADPGEAADGRLVAGPAGVFSVLPDKVLKVSLS